MLGGGVVAGGWRGLGAFFGGVVGVTWFGACGAGDDGSSGCCCWDVEGGVADAGCQEEFQVGKL